MNWISEALGLEVERLTAAQMAARAFVVFLAALILLRIAGMRTLGKQTAFDALTALITGAVLGHAVVAGAQPFGGCLAAALVIVLLHRLVAWVTFYSHRAGLVLKGKPLLIVSGGKLDVEAARRACITEEDILEAMREGGTDGGLEQCRLVYLERSGRLSVCKNPQRCE